MNLVALGSVLGSFFEGGLGPTHDELDRAVTRAGLAEGDPGPGGRAPDGTPVGKTKRIRQLFVFATDHDAKAGLALGRHVVDLLRADGMFESSIETYAGEPKITRLQDAFDRLGFDLDDGGALRPKVLDNLESTGADRGAEDARRADERTRTMRRSRSAPARSSTRPLLGTCSSRRSVTTRWEVMQAASRSRSRTRSEFSTSRCRPTCRATSAPTRIVRFSSVCSSWGWRSTGCGTRRGPGTAGRTHLDARPHSPPLRVASLPEPQPSSRGAFSTSCDWMQGVRRNSVVRPAASRCHRRRALTSSLDVRPHEQGARPIMETPSWTP